MLKINGKWVLRYFGRWATVQSGELVPVGNADAVRASALAAEAGYDRQLPHLAEGRTPPPAPFADDDDESFPTLRNVRNAFWRSKRAKIPAGELSQRSFRDYKQTTDLLVSTFGKSRRVDDLRPDDFERLRSQLAERLGVHALKRTINCVRIVLKSAHDQRMIDRPVNYGQSFNRPTAKAIRMAPAGVPGTPGIVETFNATNANPAICRCRRRAHRLTDAAPLLGRRNRRLDR